FKPYTTIERGGVKIAILGLITPTIPQWLPEKIWAGMRFDDMIETAQKWVKKIRETEQPDLMIGLFHSGVDFTYNDENENTYKNENASRLVAEKVDGFDLIFVGHDHAGWNFKTKSPSGKEVLILGTTASAQNVAVANYTLKYDKMCMIYDKKQIVGELVDMKDYPIDLEFVNHFSKNLDEVRNYISRPVGEFTEMISSRESMFGPSKFVDLIHTIQLELTSADVSFTAPLSFNTKIDAGKLYARDMFDLYRYENFLYTLELSGQEIINYLEYSYGNWFNQMKNENDHLLKFKLDEKENLVYSERTKSPELEERFYNFDSAAGIEYVVDVTKPVGDRISIVKFSNGNEFDLNKKYKVAINSYRGNGGGGHLTRGAKIPHDKLSTRVITSTEKDLRYFVMKWIENKQTVEPKLIGNWKVVPENLWQAGKQKDYQLLFK
ncbi:MAG: 5'-nucleotidase C-terminal domain-containing protein, partial [Ignavibacteria bacterium]|nr:5'-nucleotidase C-terminal domain-containing protein [Ignavibacteria bacterium]